MMAECVPPKLGNIDPQMLRTPILSVKAADFTKAVAREADGVPGFMKALRQRSEEHTSELQSLMRISYAVFCLKKKKTRNDCPSRRPTFSPSNQIQRTSTQ